MHSFMKDLGESSQERIFKAVSFTAFALCIVHSFYANWVDSTGRGDVLRNENPGFLLTASVGNLSSGLEASTACCICDQSEGEPVMENVGIDSQCGMGCRRVKVSGNECKFYNVAARGDGIACTAKRIVTDENIAVLPPETASPCHQENIAKATDETMPEQVAKEESVNAEVRPVVEVPVPKHQKTEDVRVENVNEVGHKQTIEGSLSSLSKELF